MIDLSENHRRSISVTLQLVDQALCEWAEWCYGKVRAGTLYQQLDTLSETQKGDLREKIGTIRKLMTTLHDDLDLRSKDVPTSSAIAGHASLLWEMLTELNSRGLQAYGKVSDELARYIDPIGEQPTTEMNEITHLFSKPS